MLYDAHPIDLLFDLLRSDAHISVNKALMFAIGVNEALLYSELLSRQAYFAGRDNLTEDGYFFNTADDLQSGTSLSEYQQRAAINNLRKMGLIDVQVRGIPAKRFFRIESNSVVLVNLLQEGKLRAKKAGKPTKNHSTEETSELELKKLRTNNKKNKRPPPETNQEAHFKPEHELGMLRVVGSLARVKPKKTQKTPWPQV